MAYADEHDAGSAPVTVSAQGPEQMQVEAQAMEVDSDEGLRSATIDFPGPGSWTVVVESTTPPASLAVPVTINAAEAISPAQSFGLEASSGFSCRAPARTVPIWVTVVGATLLAVAVFGVLHLLLRRGGPAAEGAA